MSPATQGEEQFATAHSAEIAEIRRRARRAGIELSARVLDEALWRAARTLDDSSPEAVARFLKLLHAEDFALAVACRHGVESAWERFISRYRPGLYGAARTMTREEVRARELADSLWADLYGLKASESGQRRSLLDHFRGQSSLKTWLHAVLARRHIDSLRAERRHDPLDTVTPERLAVADDPPDPQRPRWLQMLTDALTEAVAELDPRDRLRVRYHYADGLKVGEISRVMGEREWTVSRGLKRARRLIRTRVERALGLAGLSAEQIEQCYDSALEDWPLDLRSVGLVPDGEPAVQESPAARSQG